MKKTQPWRHKLPPELQAVIDKAYSGNATLYDDFNYLWYSTFSHTHALICGGDYGRHESTVLKLARDAMRKAFLIGAEKESDRYKKTKRHSKMWEATWGENGIHERALAKYYRLHPEEKPRKNRWPVYVYPAKKK